MKPNANLRSWSGDPASSGVLDPAFLSEDSFRRCLRLEHRRCERSQRRFALMLVEVTPGLSDKDGRDVLARLAGALPERTRETDLRGWYKDGAIIGVVFTEIGEGDADTVRQALAARIVGQSDSYLTRTQMRHLLVTVHIFPGEGIDSEPDPAVVSVLHPDGAQSGGGTRANAAKRFLDVSGGVCALVLLSPVMAAIAVAVKLTSPGPILFRQERVGRYGRKFTFLKFRSMFVANDSNVHQDYVKRYISGGAAAAADANSGAIYKLTGDRRITPIGKFLRKTSLDELPQFINVLMGDMSLVGPRPCIPYEVTWYETWHKRRFLTVKPGITGLWQVGGRSRLKFDEMVRLDLQYANSWSVWLDIKILMQTPRAVVLGDGAY